MADSAPSMYRPRARAALRELLPPSSPAQVGVGPVADSAARFTAVSSPSPLLPPYSLRFPFPNTVGVGHGADSSAVSIPPHESSPKAVAPVSRSHGGSRKHSPRTIIPHRGHVSEHSSQPS